MIFNRCRFSKSHLLLGSRAFQSLGPRPAPAAFACWVWVLSKTKHRSHVFVVMLCPHLRNLAVRCRSHVSTWTKRVQQLEVYTTSTVRQISSKISEVEDAIFEVARSAFLGVARIHTHSLTHTKHRKHAHLHTFTHIHAHTISLAALDGHQVDPHPQCSQRLAISSKCTPRTRTAWPMLCRHSRHFTSVPRVP